MNNRLILIVSFFAFFLFLSSLFIISFLGFGLESYRGIVKSEKDYDSYSIFKIDNLQYGFYCEPSCLGIVGKTADIRGKYNEFYGRIEVYSFETN